MQSKIKVLQWYFSLKIFHELAIGIHHFTFAVLPHEGSFLESDVPHAAYLYNSPLRGIVYPIPETNCADENFSSCDGQRNYIDFVFLF